MQWTNISSWMFNKAFINPYSNWVDAFIPYLYANNGTLDLNPLQEALHYPPITRNEENDWKDRVSLVQRHMLNDWLRNCLSLAPHSYVDHSINCLPSSIGTERMDMILRLCMPGFSPFVKRGTMKWHGQPNVKYLPPCQVDQVVYIIPKTIIARENWWLRVKPTFLLGWSIFQVRLLLVSGRVLYAPLEMVRMFSCIAGLISWGKSMGFSYSP